MNRRELIFKGALTAAAITAIPMGGCSSGSVLSELETYVPIGLQAFAGVVSLINPAAGGALSLVVAIIPKLWGDITVAINNYKAAGSTGVPADIIAALNAASAGISQVSTDLTGLVNVPAVDIAIAKGILLLITTTLGAIVAKFAPKPAAALASQSIVINGVTVNITGATSGKQFLAEFNNILAIGNHSEHKL
jgi:hypothetical protein